jgi:TonB family protein
MLLSIRPVLLATAQVIALSAMTITHASAATSSVCHAQNAGVIHAAQPDYPAIAEELGMTGDDTLVRVDLAADGSLQNASVLRTAGSAIFDQAALRATRQTEFRAERTGCEPVAGSYIYVVSFDR